MTVAFAIGSPMQPTNTRFHVTALWLLGVLLIMSRTTRFQQLARASLVGAIALTPLTANAFTIEFGEETTLQIDSIISVGATFRMQDRDKGLTGKRNNDPSLCGATGCLTAPETQAFLDAQGTFTQNGDNGNFNYKKGDIVAGAFKVTSDISFKSGNSGAFVRALYFYDDENYNGIDRHPDTSFQPARTRRADDAISDNGSDFDILDAYAYTGFEIGEESFLTLKAGRQNVTWGEATLNLAYSLKMVNAPDLNRLTTPGFNLKELFRPTEMVSFSLETGDTGTLSAWYQLRHDKVSIPPLGSFFSTSDVAGNGGRSAMLSFGYHAEDPLNLDDHGGGGKDQCFFDFNNDGRIDKSPDGLDNGANPAAGSTNGRAFCRGDDIDPDDDGQYGIKYSIFLDSFNGGTELAFYHSNYHSRFPYASFAPTVVNTTAGSRDTLAGAAGALEFADTMRLHLEYPEDIKLYGISMNTNVGAWSVGMEYAHRTNAPLQIHQTDLVYCALSPAFQAARGYAIPSATERYRYPGVNQGFNFQEINANPALAAQPNPGATDVGCAGLIQGQDIVEGYERFNVGQFDMTALWLSGTNPFGADQWIVLAELGIHKVYDMPSKRELPFDAPGADTTYGLPENGSREECLADPQCSANAAFLAAVQVPEKEDDVGFADGFSWGYKFITLITYTDVAGFKLQPLFAFFHDVNGVSPGPGGPFVEDRMQFWAGMLFTRGAFSGGFRYVLHTGAGEANPNNDRDFFTMDIKYSF